MSEQTLIITLVVAFGLFFIAVCLVLMGADFSHKVSVSKSKKYIPEMWRKL